MAVLKIKYLATTTKMQMHFSVFLPDAAVCDLGRGTDSKLKVLWLLHGEGGDCSDWLRLSMIEHHADKAGVALVMPNMDNSMYMDMAHGGYPYFTYLAEDLPAHVRDLISLLSDRREDNVVAGVGAGGYGALKWALRAPRMFSACACLSGEVDMAAALLDWEQRGELTSGRVAAFGSAGRIAGSADDILALARSHADKGEPPCRVHVINGAPDESRQRNRDASETLKRLGLDVRFRDDFDASGWPLWDEQVRTLLLSPASPSVKAVA